MAVLAVAMALLVSGCSIRTATAPTGDLTLHATFEDVQALTPGHYVQSSNVVVGSVREIRLDGYEARVRMSISDDHRIPVGTRAVIRRTSLLGEHYVDLELPDSFDPQHGPFFEGEGEITDTAAQPELEHIAGRATEIITAVTADDLGSVIRAGSEALDGRGPAINQLVDDAAEVADALARQQPAITATIDHLGDLGATLAPETDALVGLIEDLDSVTQVIAGSRDSLVESVDALVALATVTSDVVLVPHAERIQTMLSQLDPVLGELAGRSDVLAALLVDMVRFTEQLPTAVHSGSVLLHAWMYAEVPAVNAPGGAPDLIDFLVGVLGIRQ